MDIVLGVSMTPTTVRMVLVEGEKADGVDRRPRCLRHRRHDGSATSSAADQVIAAVLGTQESAAAGGHHLKSIGVTWSDHAEAAALRDALAARGIDDVMLVSDCHAAAALAQAVGRAVGYDTTALLFIDRDTATLSVVRTDDGSVVKVLSRTLHSDDAMAVLTEMAAAVDAAGFAAAGHVRRRLRRRRRLGEGAPGDLVAMPVSAPEEPELALARGAALASAQRARFRGVHRRPGLLAGPRRDRRPAAPTRASPPRTRSSPRSAAPRAGRRSEPRRPRPARGGPQAVPARRQRADVDLRGRRCGTGDFARGQHPADGRSAAKPRPERDCSQHRGACAPPRRCGGAAGPPRRRRPPRKPSRRRCPCVQEAPRRRRGRCTSSSARAAGARACPAPAAPPPAPEAPPPAPLPAAPRRSLYPGAGGAAAAGRGVPVGYARRTVS